jgi:glycosyltransferase involved in cell wall biosynthesis
LLVRELRRALAREAPYDVLLLHYKKEQLLALTCGKRARATLVWAEWGPVPFPLRRGLPRRAYVAAARQASLVMAISEGTRRSLCDVGVPPESVAVVPNAVRTDEIAFSAEGRARVRAAHGIPEDAFVVGCISRFHPKKRNDVVVNAVVALDDPRVHLVLAGEGETEAELRALAAPLGDRLTVIPTPGADVADVLSAFDVSVFCPSPTEGAPRAVILAMLAERSCIATGAEGVTDLIPPDAGVILRPENDVAALVAELRRRLDDRELLAREGRAARQAAEARHAAPRVAELAERLLLDATRRRG